MKKEKLLTVESIKELRSLENYIVQSVVLIEDAIQDGKEIYQQKIGSLNIRRKSNGNN